MSGNKIKFYLLITAAGLLLGGLTFAQNLVPPKLPVLYYGTVKIDKAGATSSPLITLSRQADSLEIASTTAKANGNYFLEAPCFDYLNQLIIFRFGNLIAAEAVCPDANVAPSVNLNLNFNSADQTVENNVSGIIIPPVIADNQEVKIHFTATSTLAGQTTLTLPNGLTLERQSSVAANQFKVTFAPRTVISGELDWNGTLIAPTLSYISLSIPANPSYYSQPEKIINLGLSGRRLNFDQPASIIFPGQTGKQVGFSRTGADFTEIKTVCAQNNVAGLASVANECKFNGPADLTVWTKHFTFFAIYQQVYVSPPSRRGRSETAEVKPLTKTLASEPQIIATSAPAIKPSVKPIIKPQILPQILGVKYYADGSLIRGKDKKIYLIDKGKLVVIRNLAQLKKYASQKIYDEIDEVIRQYLPFPDGSLIRGLMKKIYVIRNSKRQPIFILTELRRKYLGQKIHNVSDKILGLY